MHALQRGDLAPGRVDVQHLGLLVHRHSAAGQHPGHAAGEQERIELRLPFDPQRAGHRERQRPGIGHRCQAGHLPGTPLRLQPLQLLRVGRRHRADQRAAHQCAPDPVLPHAALDGGDGGFAGGGHLAHHPGIPAVQQRSHAQGHRRIEVAGGATGVAGTDPAGLQHRHLQSGLVQAVGDHDPGDARAHHHHVHVQSAAQRRGRWLRRGMADPDAGHGRSAPPAGDARS